MLELVKDKLTIKEPDRNYWFVRTDGGIYFDEFVNKGYIGINWNEITIHDLRNLNPEQIKDKISRIKRLDPLVSKEKSKITQIYNKILRFDSFQAGDYVVIPSDGSTRLAFGIITDQQIYSDIENVEICDFHKRRKVAWLTMKHLEELDTKFYEVKSNRHAVSSIKEYQDYIDRVVSTFYFKEDYGHLVFDVQQDEDINLINLVSLIQGMQTLMQDINAEFGLHENLEDNIIKLNLQSKGTFTLKAPVGRSLAILGLLLTLNSCGKVDAGKAADVNVEVEQLDEFAKEKNRQLIEIESNLDTLEVNKNKLHDAFL